ncbi:MAG: transglutaminase domain-containing protein, partial [Flavobacterium sp.]
TCSVEHELKRLSKMGKSVNFSTSTWKGVATRIYKQEDFVGQLNKTGYFTDDVDEVIKGLSTPEEKLEAVFSYVQQRMTFNKHVGKFCNKGVKTAYKDKTGNVAEINLMLTSMLRYAGIEAYPVLQCHRKSRISLSPSLDAFNYVTSVAVINGKEILLDASSKWSRPGLLPLRAVNWTGLMLKEDEIKDVNVIPQTTSLKMAALTVTINPTGGCNGKIRITHHDHIAALFREKYAENPDTEASVTDLEKEYSGLQISNYKVGDLKDNKKPVTEDMDFTNSNAAELLGNRIYVSPLILFSSMKNPFKEKERLYPVDFGIPMQQKYSVSIKLPDGTSVESVPESVTYKLPDNLASFKFLSEPGPDSVKIVVTLSFNKAIIAAEHYAGLKEFYDKVLEKVKQKIILKKA